MKTDFMVIVTSICLASLTGCQQENTTPFESSGGSANNNTADQIQVPLVQSANGTFYSVSCLQTNAAAIQQNAAVMQGCVVTQTSAAAGTTANGQEARSPMALYLNGHYSGFYYYLPYYGYSTSFCSYIFGTNCWDNNWYNTYFGYTNRYLSYYYNPSCNYSLGSCAQTWTW